YREWEGHCHIADPAVSTARTCALNHCHLHSSRSARILAVKRRTLLQALPAAAFLPASLWAASQSDNANPAQVSTGVYKLRVYHAAPGTLPELLARFREHTTKFFDKQGIKN